MSMSSGVNVQSFPYFHECPNCDVAGTVDAIFDPEFDAGSFAVTCGACGYDVEVGFD